MENQDGAEARDTGGAFSVGAREHQVLEAGAAESGGGSGKKQRAKAAPADIGVVGMLRWAWRQLTTMRAALILLLVLALAAIPGSLLPQRIQDPATVARFIEENGTLGEVLDAVQLFDVYSSFWFSAVYILLMVSLVGCIVPRTKQHWKAMRQQPPKAPRRLSRMPVYRTLPLSAEGDASADAGSGTETASGMTAASGADGSAEDSAEADAPAAASAAPRTREQLLDRAESVLRRAGYRVARSEDHVAAERGHLRETGNLLFHISILGVVIVMALGGLLGYSGQRVLVEGETFTNSLVSYDSFEPGAYFDPDALVDYRLTLDDFETRWDDQATGAQFGQPRLFDAKVTLSRGEESQQLMLRPNEPVRVDGSRVYLLGNGYAPVVTVRNGAGDVTFSGPVVFLPQDGANTSRGVVKVPDSGTDEQLGFVGVFLPTAAQNENGELYSQFAELRNPLLVMSAFEGDLGLDSGTPQSVYELDADEMTELTEPDGSPLQLVLTPGDTVELPGGRGSITLDDVRKYVGMDIRHDPAQVWMLPFTAALFLGLAASLFVPRRRVWVRVRGEEVEVAGLARGEDPRVEAAVEDIARRLELESPR